MKLTSHEKYQKLCDQLRQVAGETNDAPFEVPKEAVVATRNRLATHLLEYAGELDAESVLPDAELPVYDYKQEPIGDLRRWICEHAYYVSQEGEGEGSYWPYCEKVTYEHVYRQTGNITNRKPTLRIKITVTLLSDGSHGFLIDSSYRNEKFIIHSIKGSIRGDKTVIVYDIDRPLTGDEIEKYRPANVRL